MLVSVLVAVVGIGLAYHFYVRRPEVSEGLAARWAGPHRIPHETSTTWMSCMTRPPCAGTMSSARGLWKFDGAVVDGAVNGTGWLTRASAWVSHLIDKHAVDGIVNLIGWAVSETSYVPASASRRA